MKFVEKRKYDIDLIEGETLDSVLNFVAETLEISREKILSKSRKREVAEARHVFYFLAKKWTGTPLFLIAKFKGTAHSTVIHGIWNCENIKEYNKKKNYVEQQKQSHNIYSNRASA